MSMKLMYERPFTTIAFGLIIGAVVEDCIGRVVDRRVYVTGQGNGSKKPRPNKNKKKK